MVAVGVVAIVQRRVGGGRAVSLCGQKERNLPAQFSVVTTTKDDGERTNSLAAFAIVPVGVDPRSRT